MVSSTSLRSCSTRRSNGRGDESDQGPKILDRGWGVRAFRRQTLGFAAVAALAVTAAPVNLSASDRPYMKVARDASAVTTDGVRYPQASVDALVAAGPPSNTYVGDYLAPYIKGVWDTVAVTSNGRYPQEWDITDELLKAPSDGVTTFGGTDDGYKLTGTLTHKLAASVTNRGDIKNVSTAGSYESVGTATLSLDETTMTGTFKTTTASLVPSRPPSSSRARTGRPQPAP